MESVAAFKRLGCNWGWLHFSSPMSQKARNAGDVKSNLEDAADVSFLAPHFIANGREQHHKNWAITVKDEASGTEFFASVC